jgi:hypothetical protein
MSYLRHQQGRVTRLIDLDDIRIVTCVEPNPSGGMPRTPSGRITYVDGYELEVTGECAAAVLAAFKSQTVQSKEPFGE